MINLTSPSLPAHIIEAQQQLLLTPFQGLLSALPHPSPPKSATYSIPSIVGDTINEGILISRCYGKCKIGGNKIRFNAATDSDLRIIIGHCQGEVNGITRWEINDIEWSELKNYPAHHSKTEYKGTRTQTADGRFSSRACAYRGMAYTAFTFLKGDKQIGHDPHITVIMEGLKCLPHAGGAKAFTRNNAVILYDWYLNVEKYVAGDLDLNVFKSLEALCDEVPVTGSIPRYRFDFNFDTDSSINDSKKILWQSFNGRVIRSQGKLKPVWDSDQMPDGSGGLTAKTVSHAFTEDNIVEDSLTWNQPERPNLIRIYFLDSTKEYKRTSVEERDKRNIDLNGEILYEEYCYFITDAEIARRRAIFKFNKFKYTDYVASLTAFSGAGDIEIYDKVTITHSLPGWTTKQFIITSKSEDEYGRMQFLMDAYYAGCYDDTQTSDQTSYESSLPNPYGVPTSSTGISAVMVAVGTAYDFDTVRVTFTPPATDPFYLYSEIYASNDDSNYYYVGKNFTGTFTFNGLGMIYEPGNTCYIKLRGVSKMGVLEDLPAAADTSVVVSSSIRLGSFYAGTNDFWGGNAAIGNAATKIVIGNLDGTPKIALGPSADAITFAGSQSGIIIDGDGNVRFGGATHGLKFDVGTGILSVSDKVRVGSGTYIDIDGGNARIRSSNYVAGIAGSGFTLEPDLFEVGNIACRGIIRTAVFQKDVVSAIGGNLAVLPADLLNATMVANDEVALNRISEAGDTRISEAGDTRISEGHGALIIEGNETFAVGDILRSKDGINDEWLEVSIVANAPIYGVYRDKGGNYAANSNPAWEKGASVINYGVSGDGAVYMTASGSNAPYLSVLTHTGAPWSTITTRLRLGNLNGFLGYSSDLYGIAIGEATKYLKYDPTNGLQVKGKITLDSGSVVDGSYIVVDSITASQIAANTITAAEIAANTITAAKIAATTITASEIAANAITASKIAANAITASKIYGGGFGTLTITSGKMIFNTTDALEIGGSGSVKILNGGDIICISGAGQSNFFRFKTSGGSSIASIGCQSAPSRLYLTSTYIELVGATRAHNLYPATDSAYTCGAALKCWSNIYGDAGVTACSMRKFKTNIQPEILGLDFINALKPVSFEWNEKKGKLLKGTFRGVITDDVEVALTNINYADKFSGIVKEGSWEGFRYDQLFSPIIKSIQELDKKIKAMKGIAMKGIAMKGVT